MKKFNKNQQSLLVEPPKEVSKYEKWEAEIILTFKGTPSSPERKYFATLDDGYAYFNMMAEAETPFLKTMAISSKRELLEVYNNGLIHEQSKQRQNQASKNPELRLVYSR